MMKIIKLIIIILICLIIAEFFHRIESEKITRYNREYFATKMKNKTPLKHAGNQKIMGWIPYWDQANAVDSLKANTDKIDFVSLFRYRFDARGGIGVYNNAVEDKDLINFAHKNNIKVMALIANLTENTEKEEWDPRRIQFVIANRYTRKKHIADIMNLIKKNNLDGVDIDFEELKGNQNKSFNKFIEELAFELHKNGKILGVTILPVTDNSQDLTRIGNAADNLYFMTYLENGTSSQPGPMGSPVWIKKVIQNAIHEDKVDPDKIFLGIGLMGVEWRKKSGTEYTGSRDDITFNEIYNMVTQQKLEVKWDGKSLTPHIGTNPVIWFENAISVKDKLKLAEDLKVGGIAFWRLGGEDESIWDEIGK